MRLITEKKYMEMSNDELLVKFYDFTDKLFLTKEIDYSVINDIEFSLKQIPPDEKYQFEQFVEYFIIVCFQNDIEVDLDQADFKKLTIQAQKDEIEAILINDKEEIVEVALNAKSLLHKIATNLKDYLETYKGYFLIKLENNPTEEYELLFLYEENYFIRPFKKKVEKDFSNASFLNIDYFHANLEKYNKNYICVFLLMSKMNNGESLKLLKSKINAIIDVSVFETFEKYSIIFYKNDTYTIEKSNVRRDFINEVESVLQTYISNIKINFEEEKIIKALCAQFRTPLIFYKLLSSGFSGAKVLEIRPKKLNSYEGEKKYIIKYGLNKHEKLKLEIDNYNDFISGLKGFSDYHASYHSTLTHEGILYNFAISDTGLNSYSFCDILNDNCDGLVLNKKELITNLFQIPLFTLWKSEHQSREEETVKILYNQYMDPDRVFETLGIILNKEEKDIKVDDLYINFLKIWGYKIKCYTKVCHGDLHTENFFVDDEKNIYLIDFGYTNHRHALLDYTSLECSIKFKHIPRYISTDELLEFDRQLMQNDSFQLSTVLSNKRESLKELLEIINNIRYCSNSDFLNPSDFNEYYISLFIMTIRQIQYGDMNQLYAYYSAKNLAKKIVDDLGL